MAINATPSEMSEKLRLMVLQLNPNDIGLTNENYPHPVFALIMDTGVTDGSYTLSAIADGSTSLYFSSGGGIIGGGEHERVREASAHLLNGAQHFFKKAHKITHYPLPKTGDVIFYFVTFEGVRYYEASEDKLGNEQDELSDLFFVAHNVIAELRKIETKSHDKLGN